MLTRRALRTVLFDLDGTVIAEEIAHLAGAKSPQGLQQGELVRLIREAGFEALERDNLYNVYATA